MLNVAHVLAVALIPSLVAGQFLKFNGYYEAPVPLKDMPLYGSSAFAGKHIVDDPLWLDKDGDDCAVYEHHRNGARYVCTYPGYEAALTKCKKTCGPFARFQDNSWFGGAEIDIYKPRKMKRVIRVRRPTPEPYQHQPQRHSCVNDEWLTGPTWLTGNHGHGEWFTGPTNKCFCDNGNWRDCQPVTMTVPTQRAADTFRLYSGMAIAGRNDEILPGTGWTLAECQQRCREATSFPCNALEFFATTGQCVLTSAGRRDASVNEAGWDLYVRQRGPFDDLYFRDQDGDGCSAYATHPNGAEFACTAPGYKAALMACARTCGPFAAEAGGYVYNGRDGCSPAKPCTACAGDCDTDADCAGALACYQRRTGDGAAPGCPAEGYTGTTDYCYATVFSRNGHSCVYDGTHAHGEWFTGPTNKCFCDNGNWRDCQPVTMTVPTQRAAAEAGGYVYNGAG